MAIAYRALTESDWVAANATVIVPASIGIVTAIILTAG